MRSVNWDWKGWRIPPCGPVFRCSSRHLHCVKRMRRGQFDNVTQWGWTCCISACYRRGMRSCHVGARRRSSGHHKSIRTTPTQKDISASLNDVLLEGVYAAIMEQLVPRSQALSESLKGLQATCSSVDRAAGQGRWLGESELYLERWEREHLQLSTHPAPIVCSGGSSCH